MRRHRAWPALRVVEVGRHGDDRAVHLVVELALLGEVLFGASLQFAQHEGGHFRWGELAVAEADADHAAGFARHLERQQLRVALDVVDPLAHEALHRVDGAARIGQQAPLRFATDVDGAILRRGHDRRNETIGALVADDERGAVLHIGDEAVGGAEIDADDFGHKGKKAMGARRWAVGRGSLRLLTSSSDF